MSSNYLFNKYMNCSNEWTRKIWWTYKVKTLGPWYALLIFFFLPNLTLLPKGLYYKPSKYRQRAICILRKLNVSLISLPGSSYEKKQLKSFLVKELLAVSTVPHVWSCCDICGWIYVELFPALQKPYFKKLV